MGKTECTGGITKVNGVPEAISKYKKMIGYVPQDDIVLPELTVRENVLHSARIRLPANWTDIEIQKHVDILLSCLQLSHVRDSLVGSVAKPVISGGQRKRVSIGMELAAAPMALFLDEPTSGLDATSACSVMMTLKALSRLGITIVTIIHQPRQEIFESLDSLMLLGAGRMIYQGQLETAKTYFEHVGFRFPKHANPADVIMDIIAGQGQLYKKTGDFHIGALIENWKNRQNSASRGQSRDPSRAPSEGCTGPTGEEQLLRFSARIRGASWHKQFYFCLHRSLLQQSRMKSSFFTEISVGALAGFLIGLSQMKREGNFFRGFYVQPYGLLSTSVDYFSICQIALMLCLAIGLAASSPGVKTFGEEKLMYWREARAGHSRTAYYLGKVLSTFPRIVFANLHFTTLFMLLATPQVPYGIVFVLNLLYYYCIYGLASIVSMISRREDGPLLATMTSLVVGILNGMAPSLKAVKGWHMEWLWRISPGTWYAEAYFSQNVNPLRYLYEIDNAADETGYDLNSFALDIVMLIVLGTASRIFAFFGLLWVGRGKVA